MALAKSTLARIAAVAVVAAGLPGAAYYLGRAGAGPSLLDSLDARNTAAAFELRQLPEVAAAGWQAAEWLPVAARDALPSHAQVEAACGGDPAKPATWQQFGIDPQLGVALAIDLRLAAANRDPVPVFLLRVTDRARLLAALNKAGLAVTAGKQVGPVAEWSVNGAALWVGERGPDTAVVPVFLSRGDPAALRSGFEQFLHTDAEPLSARPQYAAARRDAGASLAFAWADHAALAGYLPTGARQGDAGFYAGLFPYTALWFGADGGLRLGATEGGRTALAELAKPRRNPPRCARLLPAKGWAVARSSANLQDGLTAVGKLLPPSVPANVRTALGASTAMLALVGFGWTEITEAFSGHVCGGADIASLAGLVDGGLKAPDWLLVVGVVDAQKADTLLAKLVGLASGRGGSAASGVQVAGSKGWLLQAGPFSVAVVRKDDVLLAGPNVAALETAANRAHADSLAATPLAAVVDGPVVFGLGGDVAAGIDAAEKFAGGADDLAETKQFFANIRNKLGAQRYAGFAVSLDDRGLLAQTAGDPLFRAAFGLAVPAVFGLAVPNFLRFKGRAEAADAHVQLRQIADAAVQYFPQVHGEAGGCLFPPSAPPNPPQPCCSPASDRDGDKACDAEAYAHTGVWRVLPAPSGRSAFQYSFESSGSLGDALFTARAFSDQDCDGEAVTYVLRGKAKVDESGACSAFVDGGVQREGGD